MHDQSQNQKGVSLIITSFIMIVILAVVLFVSTLLYSEIRVIKNIGNSMISFYAADSGIEKVLFYDRKSLPLLGVDEEGNGISAQRGLCTMYDSTANSDACSDSTGIDDSLRCNNTVTPQIYSESVNTLDGCDPDVCNNCQISFDTTFDNRTYYATAKVYPTTDGNSSDFEIQSRGVYGGAERQIRIFITAKLPGSGISMENVCANPITTEQGQDIDITADVAVLFPGANIGSVVAVIHTQSGTTIATVQLTLADGSTETGTWTGTWSTASATSLAYYVDITATDTLDPPNIKTMRNVLPCF